MSIFDVEHQPRAHRILQRALACQRMPHAYLFAGPEGIGKEMLARRLARLLLCSQPRQVEMPADVASAVEGGQGLDACGQCEDCRLADAETHPDQILIYRQLNRQHPDATIRKQKALFLGVDVIRHFLIERAAMSPNRSKAKVFIVREAERLNDSAQNSLLKTLEEPPKDTFLILLTNAMDRMLPTTRSRCQQVMFQLLPTDFVRTSLHRLHPDADAAAVDYVARHASGSLGVALRYLDDGLYELKQRWGVELAKVVMPPRGFAPHALAKPLIEDAKTLAKCVSQRDPDVSDTDATRVGLQALLSALADFYADAMRRRTGVELAMINNDQANVVDHLASARDERGLQAGLRHIANAEANLSRNAHTELTLETLFIALAR